MLRSRIFSIIAIVSGSVLAEDALRKVGDFALLDQSGKHHQLGKYAEKDAAIFLSISEECSNSLDILESYTLLSKSSQGSSIVFFIIDSTYRETHLDAFSRYETIDSDLPILKDDSLLITESLGMQRVGDLVIVEPHTGNILYHGTIDSDVSKEIPGANFSLQELLRLDSEILLDTNANESNQKSLLEDQESEGCDRLLSGTHNNQESPDYVTDVAPILKERCIHCHTLGGIAPFAMDSLSTVRGWSSICLLYTSPSPRD